MWGAFAISLPFVSKIAQEKSNRSRMFVLEADCLSASPICSAIEANLVARIRTRAMSRAGAACSTLESAAAILEMVQYFAVEDRLKVIIKQIGTSGIKQQSGTFERGTIQQ